MKTIYSLSTLIGVMAIAMIFMFQGHTVLNLATLILLITLMVFMTFLNLKLLFPTALSMVLLFGFFLTGWSLFFQTAPPQTELIIQHILFTIFVISSWLFFSQTRSLVQLNSELYKQVEFLKKFEPVTKLLTNTEFENRVEILLTALKRRNEAGYLVHLVPNNQIYANAALINSLGQIILKSVRENYDLVTRNRDGSFTMFLQKTDDSGVQIILKRIHTNSKEIITQPNSPYSVYSSELINYEYTKTLNSLFEKRREA